MSGVVRHLLHLEPWYLEWLMPVRDAFELDDEESARLALDSARTALAASQQLSADERCALGYEFAVFEYHFVERRHPRDRHIDVVQAAMDRAIASIRETPQGPLSDSLQAYWLIAFAGQGIRRGYFDLSVEEFMDCYRRVSERQRGPEFWYFASTWAFYRRQPGLLEEALEVHATQTTGVLDDYFFGRTRMMWRLVTGEATKQDVRDLIRSYAHPQRVIDFRNLFLAPCAEAGLIDDEIMLLLETREAFLDAALTGLPEPRTAPTRSLMQNTKVLRDVEEE